MSFNFQKSLLSVMIIACLSFPSLGIASYISLPEDAYFDQSVFVSQVANLIEQHYPSSAKSRLSFIKTLRAKLVTEYCVSSGTSKTICSVGLDRPLSKRLIFHSYPLVNPKLAAITKNQVSALSVLSLMQTSLQDNLNVDPHLFEKFKSEIKNGGLGEEIYNCSERLCAQTRKLADPIVIWLLKQPFQSVDHLQLIRVATRVYGDPFTAIGVLGTIFDEERMACNSRKRNCVLGNRMKPLFPKNKIDNVGYNYHFWSYLSYSISGELNYVLDPATNLIFEHWQGDRGDSASNLLGMIVGKKIYKKVSGALL